MHLKNELMNKCIWCRKPNQDKDIEHIFPEALGCPDGFYLDKGLVCKRCNNNLAHLDRVVIGEFEIPAFMADVPRKKNKPPKVSSFGNVKASIVGNEKTFFINMDRNQSYTFPNGEIVAPYRGKPRDIKASMVPEGNLASISFNIEIGKSKKFNRGIIKIAFSILAKAFGSAECNKEKYNHIRRFVRSGKGEIPLLMMNSESSDYRTQSYNPYISQNGNYMICFRFSIVDFSVDLATDFSGFYSIRDKMTEVYGKNGFSWLPLDF